MPVIILEGIDGSGKSTLAEALKQASPIPATIVHRGPLEGTVEDELIYPLNRVGSDELLIADRWHVGEMIYGPIYRGRSEVFGEYNTIIENLLQDMNAVRIIMSPPLDIVEDRLNERGEDYLLPEHAEEVYNFYENYAIQFGWILLDEVTDTTVDQILRAALEEK